MGRADTAASLRTSILLTLGAVLARLGGSDVAGFGVASAAAKSHVQLWGNWWFMSGVIVGAVGIAILILLAWDAYVRIGRRRSPDSESPPKGRFFSPIAWRGFDRSLVLMRRDEYLRDIRAAIFSILHEVEELEAEADRVLKTGGFGSRLSLVSEARRVERGDFLAEEPRVIEAFRLARSAFGIHSRIERQMKAGESIPRETVQKLHASATEARAELEKALRELGG